MALTISFQPIQSVVEMRSLEYEYGEECAGKGRRGFKITFQSGVTHWIPNDQCEDIFSVYEEEINV